VGGVEFKLSIILVSCLNPRTVLYCVFNQPRKYLTCDQKLIVSSMHYPA